MKVAIFDAFNGASGDMILASMLGVAINEKEIEEVVRELSLDVEFEISEKKVRGIHAKRVIVKEHGEGRSFREVLELIENSKLDFNVKRNAISVFQLLALAEGSVHNRDYREAVFHEVGSDDAVFDVVCCVKAFENLKALGYRFYVANLRTGSGFVEFSHGKYPVPVPAVVEILKRSELEVILDGEGELLTPTGAAILAHYCKKFPNLPIQVKEVSYGAGSRETEVPNVLRLILGYAASHDSVAVIESNVDDVSGEIVGYAVKKLLENKDVLDVAVIPALGKKMRMTSIFKVIAPMQRAEEVAKELMELTGTLGVRIIPVHHRLVSDRVEESVRVEIGGKEFSIRVKKSFPGFEHLKPEFEDLEKVAEATGLPLLLVYREVLKNIVDKIGAENADPDGK